MLCKVFEGPGYEVIRPPTRAAASLGVMMGGAVSLCHVHSACWKEAQLLCEQGLCSQHSVQDTVLRSFSSTRSGPIPPLIFLEP